MDKRDLIVLAAQELFALYGPHKVTVAEIIQRAQVARGTFYKHFTNRDAVFLEVIDRERGQLMASIRQAVDAAVTARQKMKALWLVQGRKSQELRNYHGLTEDSFPGILPDLQAFLDRMLHDMRAVVRTILEGGVARGELDVPDADATAQALMLAVGISDFQTMRRVERSQVDLEQLIDRLLDVVFTGLESRAGP